jgi:hypothetical protein
MLSLIPIIDMSSLSYMYINLDKLTIGIYLYMYLFLVQIVLSEAISNDTFKVKLLNLRHDVI